VTLRPCAFFLPPHSIGNYLRCCDQQDAQNRLQQRCTADADTHLPSLKRNTVSIATFIAEWCRTPASVAKRKPLLFVDKKK